MAVASALAIRRAGLPLLMAIAVAACTGNAEKNGAAGGDGQAGGASGGDVGRGGGVGSGGVNGDGGTKTTAGGAPGSMGGHPPASGGAGAVDAGAPDALASGVLVPSIVAVGYGGLRVLSKDGGKTWGNRVSVSMGNDEWNLLRAVAYGGGLYVAVGNPGVFTSPDGATWRKALAETGFLQGIAFDGVKTWVGGGVSGRTVISQDAGQTWRLIEKSVAPPQADSNHIRGMVFVKGRFYASTQYNNVVSSADGLTWRVERDMNFYQIDYCRDAFRNQPDCRPRGANGVFVQPKGWSLERSTDGKTWQHVYSDVGHNDFSAATNPFAFGFSPP